MTDTAPTIKSIAKTMGKAYTKELQVAFPDIMPPMFPCGYLLLCQLRLPKTLSKGGLIIPTSARDDERYRIQTSLVRALGPSCFRRRDNLDAWPEGNWVNEGDFIRGPLYGGDRFAVPTGEQDEEVIFVFLKDSDIIARVTGDPLMIKTLI